MDNETAISLTDALNRLAEAIENLREQDGAVDELSKQRMALTTKMDELIRALKP